MADEKEPPQNWLEETLGRMNAVYRRYGKDGLREFSIHNVGLLLSSKEMAFRDAPKGHGLTDEQLAANRGLELEIRDLTGYLNSQFTQANAHLPHALRQWLGNHQNRPRQQSQERGKNREHDR